MKEDPYASISVLTYSWKKRIPGPVEATSSTLEVAQDDSVWKRTGHDVTFLQYHELHDFVCSVYSESSIVSHGNISQTIIVFAADAARAVAYSPESRMPILAQKMQDERQSCTGWLKSEAFLVLNVPCCCVEHLAGSTKTKWSSTDKQSFTCCLES